jgi:hypothetical protein
MHRSARQVLLGIGIGEGLSAARGTATYALGLIVLVTLFVAIVTGVGYIGQGMMFANQAAASAILVITLVINRAIPPGRITAILVSEPLGF